MKKGILFFVISLMLAVPARADTLTAKLNRNPVPAGETFVLSLEYAGDPGTAQPDLSALEKDFKVYMVSSSYKGVYRNGQMSKTYVWSISMAAEQTGEYTIPPLSVNNVRSQPLVLKVVEASELPAADEPRGPVFSVTRSIDNPHPFVQQQLNYSFTITTDAALQGNAPQFLAENPDDWIIRVLGDPQISTRMKDGAEMRDITFNYALFPQRSGKLVIPEVRFSGYYVDSESRGHNAMQGLLGAFGGLRDPGFGLEMFGRRVPVSLKARPISIEVGKIPAANNGSWWLPAKNAVITSDWQEKTPVFKSGEAVSREIYLRVTGVIDSQLPEIRFADIPGMKQYPEKPEVKSMIENGDVVSLMTVKNVYIPEKSGRYTIPETAVVWYDVENNRMEKAVLPAMTVEVAPGAATVPTESAPPSTAPAATSAAAPANAAAATNLPAGNLLWYILAAFAGGITVSLTAVFLILRRFLPAEGKKPEAKAPAAEPVSVGKAVRNNDLRAVRDNVIAWAEKSFPEQKVRNLDDVVGLVADTDFAAELQKLQTALYSGRTADFDAARFMDVFARVGKRQKKKKAKEKDGPLLPRLYK